VEDNTCLEGRHKQFDIELSFPFFANLPLTPVSDQFLLEPERRNLAHFDEWEPQTVGLAIRLSTPDLGEIIQLEEGTVRRHIRRGHVPYFRVGTTLRFDPSDIGDWLEANSLSPRSQHGGATKNQLDRALLPL
jgi:excisionase family DNA binding protein